MLLRENAEHENEVVLRLEDVQTKAPREVEKNVENFNLCRQASGEKSRNWIISWEGGDGRQQRHEKKNFERNSKSF